DMILAIGNDGQFAKFCAIAGHPEWSADPRFTSNAERVRHRAALVPLLRQATVMRTSADWMRVLEDASVPCGPINNLAQVFDDAQVVARGLKINMPHPLAGSVPLVANPIRLSETPVTYQRPPPLLGEHTAAILARVLGVDAARLAQLAASKVI
ncbi:MAG: CoA transferase, partial [Proteobacteria bacterium]|nr:CoA transferase [Pseudomonadota bacterium]